MRKILSPFVAFGQFWRKLGIVVSLWLILAIVPFFLPLSWWCRVVTFLELSLLMLIIAMEFCSQRMPPDREI